MCYIQVRWFDSFAFSKCMELMESTHFTCGVVVVKINDVPPSSCFCCELLRFTKLNQFHINSSESEIAEQLSHHCSVKFFIAGDCPFHIALKTGNLFLVECLLNKMCDEGFNLHSLEEKTSAKSNSGNILHSLLKLPFKVC